MTTKLATLAEAEEDINDDDDEEEEDSNSDDNDNNLKTCTFNVPYFHYIDEEDVEEEQGGGFRNRSDHTWFSCSVEERCCNSSPHRYIVVSGTPLKILEHLLSDLRLDDQRGAPESRESGKLVDMGTSKHVNVVYRVTSVREYLYTRRSSISIEN